MKPQEKTLEILQEGWVKFQRIKCKEGFIDRWMGDCIDNPNNSSKNNLNLNASISFFRLNGFGRWVSVKDFQRDFFSLISFFSDCTTSQEIWDTSKLIEQV